MVFLLSTNAYADLRITEYFNNLEPQKHVNKLYSEERKNELNQNIIKYDDIDDLVHLYNVDVANLWNNWEYIMIILIQLLILKMQLLLLIMILWKV